MPTHDRLTAVEDEIDRQRGLRRRNSGVKDTKTSTLFDVHSYYNYMSVLRVYCYVEQIKNRTIVFQNACKDASGSNEGSNDGEVNVPPTVGCSVIFKTYAHVSK